MKYDKDEKSIIDAYEKGKLVFDKPSKKEIKAIKATAKRTMTKDKNGRIILGPFPDDLIAAGRGKLKSKSRALRLLLAEREAEAER